jgi:CTP synthase
LDPSRPFLGLIAAASGTLDEVLKQDLKQRSHDF